MQETVTAESEASPAEDKEKVTITARWLSLPGRTRTAFLILLLTLIVYGLVFGLVPRFKGTTSTQGDEPHYLLVTESILRDGDVYLTNNYEAKQYLPYFQQTITMWHVARGKNGRFVSTHPMFLSLLVLPGFWAFGYPGAAVTMILLRCFAAMFTFLIMDHRGGGDRLFLLHLSPALLLAADIPGDRGRLPGRAGFVERLAAQGDQG
jgi:hypothetical protein